MPGCGCDSDITRVGERKTLVALLAINAIMFMGESVAGWLAQSTALIADSLDMFADAAVYGIGLYAVSRGLGAKARAAAVSGMVEITLALGALGDIGRRVWFGSDPEPVFMIGVGLLALVANVTCLALLAKHREGGVHMRASWIFSKNDVIANVGVIMGGVLIVISGSPVPDLVMGLVIVTIVLRGGILILREARAERRAAVRGGDRRQAKAP